MDKYFLKCFALSAGVLPERLWRAVYSLEEEDKAQAEEFRLRVGRPFAVTVGGRIKTVYFEGETVTVTEEEMEECVERATKSSYHSYNHQIKEGYISLPYGGRMGVCGSVIRENGETRTIKDISSLNIRIAKQVKGVSSDIFKMIRLDKRPNILIISKAGDGKTTFLRDLVRNMSDSGIKIGLCDERYEIAASSRGRPAFDIGRNTDVISGGDKEQNCDALIRAMSPSYIALDEITKESDADCLIKAGYMGASFVATAHADSIKNLGKRDIYRRLLDKDIFDYVVEIKNTDGKREIFLSEKGGQNDKNSGSSYDNRFVRVFGKVHIQTFEGQA